MTILPHKMGLLIGTHEITHELNSNDRSELMRRGRPYPTAFCLKTFAKIRDMHFVEVTEHQTSQSFGRAACSSFCRTRNLLNQKKPQPPRSYIHVHWVWLDLNTSGGTCTWFRCLRRPADMTCRRLPVKPERRRHRIANAQRFAQNLDRCVCQAVLWRFCETLYRVRVYVVSTYTNKHYIKIIIIYKSTKPSPSLEIKAAANS